MKFWPFGKRKNAGAVEAPVSAGQMAMEADGALWAIRETALDSMSLLAANINLEAAMEAYTSALSQEIVPEKPYEMEGEVALIPVCGPLMKTDGFWCWWFGGTSYERLRGLLEAAGQDADVKEVRLIFDTPGGMVAGGAVTAQAIRDLDKIKPVHGYLSDQCCSMGFWLASQCRTVTANAETAEIGNIGTVLKVDDTSKMFAMMGIERKMYRSTDLKGAGTAGVPITKAQDAEFQSGVDAANAVFVAEVAAGRGVPLAKAREWATAHVYLGKEALAAGLIDKIEILSGEGVVAEDDADDSDEPADGDADDLDAARAVPPAHAEKPAAPLLTTAILTPEATTRPATNPEQRPAPVPTAASESAPTLPAPAGKPEGTTMLKELLMKALGRHKLNQMAVAVVNTEDNAEALAAAMAEQVKAEVEAKFEKDPLVMACHAAGIRSSQDFQVMMNHATRGQEALSEMRESAKQEAIRLYGAENGLIIAQQVAGADYRTAKMLKESWGKEADTKFGLGANGEAATRTSAPKQPVAANAEETQTTAEKPKTLWEKLTPEQQKHATALGVVKTDADKEAFAKRYFDSIA